MADAATMNDWHDADAIRAALDLSIVATDVPVTIIDKDIFAGRARRELLRIIPAAYDKTGTELESLKTALNLLIASYIAPSLPSITGESLPTSESYSRQGKDWRKHADMLLAQAMGIINDIATPTATVTAEMPTMFGLASGTRGQ